MTSRHVTLAVAVYVVSVLKGLWGKNTDKDTSREGASTLRRFHFGMILLTISTLTLVTYKVE